MKKLRLRESVKNFLGIMAFYLIIVGGVILVDARMKQINDQKKADVQIVQTAPINR